MNFTILKDDKIIIKDGVVLELDFIIDQDIHAVQFDGKICEIEYKDNKPNFVTTDISKFRTILEDFDNQIKLNEEARAKAEAEAEAEANRYENKRKRAYEEQGLTIEALTVALIEANAGNLADLETIQEKRAKIKNDIPKD